MSEKVRESSQKSLFQGIMIDQVIATSMSVEISEIILLLGQICFPDVATLNEKHINQALNFLKDKMWIFYDGRHTHNLVDEKAGNISTKNCVMADQFVYPVVCDAPCFHPKIILVRYHLENSGEVYYRLQVSSKNLTGSRSYEVACVLEGKVEENQRPINHNLSDFIAYLKCKSSIKKETVYNINIIEEELKKVKFCLFPDDSIEKIQDIAVVVSGIKKQKQDNLINKLIPSENNFNPDKWFILSPDYETSQTDIDFFPIYRPEGIPTHAKLYFHCISNQLSEMWIGSANLSHAGLNDNVECVVYLMGEFEQPQKDNGNITFWGRTFTRVVFSNYKMIPRAISTIFSEYANKGNAIQNKSLDLSNMNQKVGNCGTELLSSLMNAYNPETGDGLSSVVERVKKEIKDLAQRNEEILNLSKGNLIDCLSLYVIASPYACAWRLLPDGEKRGEVAKDIASAFDDYFKKRSAVLDRLDIKTECELLQYCADGNLQAVLAEYAFCNGKWADNIINVLKVQMEGDRKTDQPYQYEPKMHVYQNENYKEPKTEVKTVNCHFALRYDGDYNDNGNSETKDDVRAFKKLVKLSFNSPFWPFILCTTSAGQEGVDLDTYSYRIMHYSLPNSTMAFEQRDGRIDRRRSLLARKKMVEYYSRMSISYQNYWEELFKQNSGCSGMSPDWVQNVKSGYKLERIIPYFPGSPEYVYFMKLVEEKDKYRGKFGMPNESVGNKNSSLKLNKIKDY